ncbi:MAG TPA: thioesterase family protein [Streptosporangiaceae bacterium]|nr:thioesterase family protein [Streptosporangiaceae bacterium]
MTEPVVRGPFQWLSPVYFDELDLNGALHNARFAVHVERAQSALFEQLGRGWTSYADRDPDLRYVVRELHVEFLAPLEAPGSLLVELAAGKLGRTSATYLFRCADPESGQTLAQGHRVIIKIGQDGRPAPWSDWYRATFQSLEVADA